MDVNIYKLKNKQHSLFGPLLDEEQAKLFEEDKTSRSVGKIRFANILAMFTVLFFGILDYFQIEDSKTFLILIIIRFSFIIAVLIPFYKFAEYPVFKKHTSLYLFSNALAYIIFLQLVAFISIGNLQALFHVYLGILISIISIHLLIGLNQNYALLISLISILISNYIILYFRLIPHLPIPLFHINIWFLISSILAYFFGIYFESISKMSFLTNLKLKEENGLKNKFFSVVAHDLKNMIASQYSITEYMKDQHTQLSEEKRNDMLEILNQSTSDVMEVFEDLMQWIKSQLDTITIHKQKTKLARSIDTIVDLMQVSASNKNISINKDLNDNTDIITDINLFSLILRNILGNAIKFSHPDSNITIKSSSDEDISEIQIIDEGIGMNQETIDRIFRLEKMESTRGTNGETGTGLGMILSKELIGILNGELIINSKLHQGTTITLLIPNS